MGLIMNYLNTKHSKTLKITPRGCIQSSLTDEEMMYVYKDNIRNILDFNKKNLKF